MSCDKIESSSGVKNQRLGFQHRAIPCPERHRFPSCFSFSTFLCLHSRASPLFHPSSLRSSLSLTISSWNEKEWPSHLVTSFLLSSDFQFVFQFTLHLYFLRAFVSVLKINCTIINRHRTPPCLHLRVKCEQVQHGRYWHIWRTGHPPWLQTLWSLESITLGTRPYCKISLSSRTKRSE